MAVGSSKAGAARAIWLPASLGLAIVHLRSQETNSAKITAARRGTKRLYVSTVCVGWLELADHLPLHAVRVCFVPRAAKLHAIHPPPSCRPSHAATTEEWRAMAAVQARAQPTGVTSWTLSLCAAV